jgi:hypothetical protein
MANRYKFFFSYASRDYKNATKEILTKDGYHRVNYLDNFFDEVCKGVGKLTGNNYNEVGYRDRDRLEIGDFWDKHLVEGLQNSSVLLAIISPAYLKSENCGREVQFFIERLNKLPPQQRKCHRIIPIFWVEANSCFEGFNGNIHKFISELQWNQPGMPEKYPYYIGVEQLYNLIEVRECAQVVEQISKRIVELARLRPRLRKLSGKGDFSELPSVFQAARKIPTTVASGPTSTNVIYVVGNRREMATAKYVNIDIYNNQRQNWRPFADDTTVEQATQKGLKRAGQTKYCNLGFPKDLLAKIAVAKERNSPVLMVLDRHSLSISKFQKSMQEYDERDYFHVGLVTAGGSNVKDKVVQDAFQSKFTLQRRYHIWTVPSDCQAYVSSVSEVVTNLKCCLQQIGTPAVKPQPLRPMPRF